MSDSVIRSRAKLPSRLTGTPLGALNMRRAVGAGGL